MDKEREGEMLKVVKPVLTGTFPNRAGSSEKVRQDTLNEREVAGGESSASPP